jgi:hypothetical protein
MTTGIFNLLWVVGTVLMIVRLGVTTSANAVRVWTPFTVGGARNGVCWV